LFREQEHTKGETPFKEIKESIMQDGERLVIVGGGGVGSPAAMMARKLMPGVEVTLIREEGTFIVR